MLWAKGERNQGTNGRCNSGGKFAAYACGRLLGMIWKDGWAFGRREIKPRSAIPVRHAGRTVFRRLRRERGRRRVQTIGTKRYAGFCRLSTAAISSSMAKSLVSASPPARAARTHSQWTPRASHGPPERRSRRSPSTHLARRSTSSGTGLNGHSLHHGGARPVGATDHLSERRARFSAAPETCPPPL